jgi:septal ring factor EnvC (AmiA/AmiB activator)
MTRSCSHLKALPVPCILGALIAIGAPAAAAQDATAPPPTIEQCEQAQRDVESLRPALAEARDQVSAKESRVRKLKRAINRTSSRRKRRQLKRKLAGARKSLRMAKDGAEETEAQLTAARETMSQC